MIVEVFVYLILAFYMDQVLPSEFGVRRNWHFPITETWKLIKRYRKHGNFKKKSEEVLAMNIEVDEEETKFEDSDVKAEREKIVSHDFNPTQYPLIMSNMRKVYAGRGGEGAKLAVKDVTFAVEKQSIFGLLGPNGAGKTTLISILTGLYEASAGQSTIGGFDIKSETASVYKSIGICPQFDILWEDLTVGEHLYFYARLKGIKSSSMRSSVVRALTNVSLQAFENRLTKGLSGGEKRRLSIAIALLGKPTVIFLDEPTVIFSALILDWP